MPHRVVKFRRGTLDGPRGLPGEDTARTVAYASCLLYAIAFAMVFAAGIWWSRSLSGGFRVLGWSLVAGLVASTLRQMAANARLQGRHVLRGFAVMFRCARRVREPFGVRRDVWIVSAVLVAILVSAGWLLGFQNTLPYAVLSAGNLLCALAYRLTPGTVLLLGTSRQQTLDLHLELRSVCRPYRVVHLLDGDPASFGAFGDSAGARLTNAHVSGAVGSDCLRTDDGLRWPEAVADLENIALVIVIDVRYDSEHVRHELVTILQSNMVQRTVFVATMEGRAEAVEAARVNQQLPEGVVVAYTVPDDAAGRVMEVFQEQRRTKPH